MWNHFVTKKTYQDTLQEQNNKIVELEQRISNIEKGLHRNLQLTMRAVVKKLRLYRRIK